MPTQQAHEDDLGWNIGRYTVYGEIAAGGMATVHIGRMVGEVGFAKLVAIKRLHTHLAKDPEFLDMFLDEVRLASRIRHPNVVQPLDVVVTGGEVFLVMEYIHGDSLARLLRVVRQQTLHIPMKIASAILIGALNGLHSAHEAKDERGEPLNIIHRDVSPQNVMVGVDGVARVLDFGVAKAGDQVHATKVGELKGKLAYMAPEQLKGKSASRRSDIYAASIVLWECLTGHKLFDVDTASLGALMNAQVNIQPPSKINPQVPPDLDALVMKGLSVNPDLRHQTAAELANELTEILPPAPQQQVGQWVENTAKATLTERGLRIAEIERTGADTSSKANAAAVLSGRHAPVSELSGSLLVEEQSSSSIKAKPVSGRPSAPSVPPAVPSRPATTTGKQLVVPSARPSAPMPEPSQPLIRATPAPPPPVADFGPEFESTRQQTPAHAFSVPGAPLSHSTSLAPPEVPLELAKPAKITITKMPGRKRSLIPYLWIVFGIALIVGVVLSPELIRRRIIEAAARDGVTLTNESIELSLQGMRINLKKVKMTTPDLPGVSMQAEGVDLFMNGLEVDSITVRNVQLVVDGRYGEQKAALEKWSGAHPDPALLAQARRLKFEGVHLSWSNVFGPGTKVDGTGAVGEFGRIESRPIGADGTITLPALTFETPIGALGPWRFDLVRNAGRTNATVLLDAGSPGGPTATASIEPDGRTVVDCKVTRGRLLAMGVPLVLLGQKPEDASKIDVAVHLDISTTISGTVHLGFYDIRLGNAGPTDAAIDAHFNGPRGAAPIPMLEGVFTFAGQPGPLAGAITVADDGVRVEATAKVKGCPPEATFSVAVDTRDPTKTGGGLATKSPCKLPGTK